MAGLDDHIAALLGAPAARRAPVVEQAIALTKPMRWVPNPGPQVAAWFTEADETLFGGEAGGGKSDLVIGLSLGAHERSLVLRRTNAEAVKLVDRFEEIIGDRNGWSSQHGTWRIDGRIIDIGGCQHENDKQKRKGIPHDLKAFDELVDFTESQYNFIIAWNRSKNPKQRCRIVCTTNPPTRPEAMWVVRRWAPWLDPKHPKPAHDGELRWFTTIKGIDTEVDGPGPHLVSGRKIMAKSRTFIRSKLQDNPDLTQTGDYEARLNALPEAYRLAYAEGRFDASLKDSPMQAIPTAWVRAAMERWVDRPPVGVPMCGIGVDCTGGGDDPMVISARYDGWYQELVVIPGSEIPPERVGAHSAGLVVSHRRDRAIVVVDMGGGYGGALYEALHGNEIPTIPHKGAEASTKRTKDGYHRFYNKRTEVWWRFREALDPAQAGGSIICLPPDAMLMADLCAPGFWECKIDGQTAFQIEPKEKVVGRLNRSTDRGDAVVMGWSAGPTYVTDADDWAAKLEHQPGRHRNRQTQANMSERGIRLTGRR
jgi:hypothetical protein